MTEPTDLARSAKAHVADLGAQTKSAATQEARAQAEKVKGATATRAQTAANAASAAADEFDPSSPQAQAMQHVADHIEGVATSLRHADIKDLADQATEMAKRNPMLFIGGAAIAGFALARFLKAKSPQETAIQESDDPWAAAPASASTGTYHGSRSHG